MTRTTRRFNKRLELEESTLRLKAAGFHVGPGPDENLDDDLDDTSGRRMTIASVNWAKGRSPPMQDRGGPVAVRRVYRTVAMLGGSTEGPIMFAMDLNGVTIYGEEEEFIANRMIAEKYLAWADGPPNWNRPDSVNYSERYKGAISGAMSAVISHSATYSTGTIFLSTSAPSLPPEESSK